MLRAPLIVQSASVTFQLERIPGYSSNKKTLTWSNVLCLFSFIKLIITSGFLFKNRYHSTELKIWLSLMMLCDLLHFIFLVANVITLSNAEQLHDDESGPLPQNTIFRFVPRLLNIIQTLNNLHYFILVAWAHSIYYISFSKYPPTREIITSFVAVSIFWGYGFIVCALVSAVKDRKWLSFFTFFPVRRESQLEKSDFYKSLFIKSYSSREPGSSECFICLNNYNEGEKLAELPCNSKHHFHEACIRKWAKLKGTCPLCRNLINSLGNAPTQSDVELRQI